MKALIRHLRSGLFGLQFRTTLLLTCVVLAATGLTGAVYLRISSALTVSESKRHVRNIAAILAAVITPTTDPVTMLASASSNAIAQADKADLSSLAEAVAPDGELAYLLFTDRVGNLLAGYQRGAGNIKPFILSDERRVSVEPIDRPLFTVQGNLGPRVDIVYPVTALSSLASGAAPPPTIGYVRLGVSLATAETRLVDVINNVVGLAVGITLLMVPLGYEVVRHVVAPINRLSAAVRAFAGGDLDIRVDDRRRDEIGVLSRSFNGMADELANSHNQLLKLNAELEDRVLQRTLELEKANKQLAETAARDSLTGLYNRRHFGNLLNQLFAEAVRYGTGLSCMMMDLDNFKRVNDSLGHQVGDQLLQLAAQAIRETVRESDVAVRYGGDEFVVLLPQTSPTEARASAQRLLENFQSAIAARLPEASIATLSVGISSREGTESGNPIDLVNMADEALYLAKAGGKNRITLVRPVAIKDDE